jgi:hypothetical protein
MKTLQINKGNVMNNFSILSLGKMEKGFANIIYQATTQ